MGQALDKLTNELFPLTGEGDAAGVETAPEPAWKGGPAQRSLEQEAEARVMGARPGVPLDITTGVPSMDRFKLAWIRDVPNQVRALQAQYGPENVDVSPGGDIILRNVLDKQTGKVKDILAPIARSPRPSAQGCGCRRCWAPCATGWRACCCG